ncbi:hypothetical protein LOD99_15112 [Oopsacas minuta]|uniref:Uncharacterized protein n=1 Tax=Oopsacas minuta TaxID=111878 RepID=A0AAV7KC19_9METZ|nr:hypothetical protein LOD99_15112 [Oopsacas minuta]
MGASQDGLKFYHGALNFPFPPYPDLFNTAQKDVIVAAELWLDRVWIRPTSYDWAHQMRSSKSGEAYEVACNSCPECCSFENKLWNGMVTELEHQDWKQNHDDRCPAKYAELASVQLDSALAPYRSPSFARGIVLSGLVCDGDNKTHQTLKNAKVYQELGIDLEIDGLECLSLILERG